VLSIDFLNWDYEVTGIKIYRLEDYTSIDELKLFILNEININDFIFARIEAENIKKINDLFLEKFYLVDLLAIYKYNIKEKIDLKYETRYIKLIDIRDKKYTEECLNIADSEFRLGHIYQDENLGELFGKQIYNAWCLNNLKGRGETFAYIEDDIVYGFVQVISKSSDILQIDLIGVKSSKQSTGIGSLLIDYIKNYAYENKYKKIIVGTQETNYNANKFYFQKKFIKKKSVISLHFKK